MLKIQINKTSFPLLFEKFKTAPNILAILQVMGDEFYYLLNLEALEMALQLKEENGAYFKLFERIISGIDEKFYTRDEILPVLASRLNKEINTDDSLKCKMFIPDAARPSLMQLGLYEKLRVGALSADLKNLGTINQYGFSIVDMTRSAKRFGVNQAKVRVCELEHLRYVGESLNPRDESLFIRSRFGDERGLSQWILTHYNNSNQTIYIYSESPLSEQDKIILMEFLQNKGILLHQVVEEGGTSALSIASGIRAVSRLVESIGGAGLTSTADYASLLVEWVWFTMAPDINDPIALKYTSSLSFAAAQFTWDYFKEHVLRYDTVTKQYSLLDLSTSTKKEDLAYNEHLQMRSYALGVDWILADNDKKVHMLTIEHEKETVSLQVPSRLSINRSTDPDVLTVEYLKCLYEKKGYARKARYAFPTEHLTRRRPGEQPSVEALATAFVLNVFRACAKLKTLSIGLPPAFQLNDEEINLVCYLMESNPFVCDLVNPLKNKSIETIKLNLQHIFARNRWLSINNYLPPLLGDFWGVASRYWVAYLKKAPDLFENKHEQIEFKRCVKEMGIHGLLPLLEYLKREAPSLKPEFYKLLQNREVPPIFYGGCGAKDIKFYAKTLLRHLQQGEYFPFGHFMFSFIPEIDNDLLDMLVTLNGYEFFKQVSLVDCLRPESDVIEFSEFMDTALLRARNDEKWVCPIQIPELDVPSQNPLVIEIRSKYIELNNVLMNRTRRKQTKHLEKINCFKIALDPSVADLDGGVTESETDDAGLSLQKGAQERQVLSGIFAEKVRELHEIEFPLERAGGTALQMQQQQQIKQERSLCLDNENEKGTAYEDVLPSRLITYDNIEKVLGEYYAALDIPKDESKALLKNDTESLLQGFFHTWVNANPHVTVAHVIHKITPDAAKMLLKYHRQLSGGLNPYNLPKGFYTQRDSQGDLILGFKLTLSYTTTNNPLTLQLVQTIPEPEICLGDFRQFNPTELGDILSEDAISHLKLFSQLQPVDASNAIKNYQLFLENNNYLLNESNQVFVRDNEDTICKNWHLFYSLHQLKGDAGIDWFKTNTLEIASPQDIVLLLSKVSPALRTLGLSLFAHQSQPMKRALAQIYFQYGEYGLERFLTALQSIQHNLGSIFVNKFFSSYLSLCMTFNPLMHESALESLDEMVRVLSSNNNAKQLWLSFLKNQKSAVGWEPITTLWKGYYYFYQHVKNLDLHDVLTVEVLNGLLPARQNMLVCFDRLLHSLDKIPTSDQRKAFIKKMPELDLTEGGLPYAVRHDGYVFVDPALQLNNFYKGTPSYAVDMKSLFTWTGEDGVLNMRRALASKSRFTSEDYQTLSQRILDTTPHSKNSLLWGLHTKHTNMNELLESLNHLPNTMIAEIAKHFHRVFYVQNAPYAIYPFRLFELLNQSGIIDQILNLLTKYPSSMVVFNSMKALYVYNKLDQPAVHRVMDLMQAAPAAHLHLEQGVLLATVFGVSLNELNAFYRATLQLKLITRHELTTLIQQLLSLDIENTPSELLSNSQNWVDILRIIQEMDQDPLERSEYRKNLMITLKERGLIFKSSVSGDYRIVNDVDLSQMGFEQTFELHSERLNAFFKSHIAISDAQANQGPLVPLREFFRRMQLNKTYINEIEPLLATLEKIVGNEPVCWAAPYFDGLLRSLHPKDEKVGFPIGLLEAVLTEENSPFLAKALDEMEIDFSADWSDLFSAILSKSETFSRDQQANLVRIAIRMYSITQDKSFVPNVIERLNSPKFNQLRGPILSLMLSDSAEQFESNLALCEALVNANFTDELENHWGETCQLWITLLTNSSEFKTVFVIDGLNKIASNQRKALVMHIVAWSSFTSHQHLTVAHENYLEKGSHSKAAKLLERLQGLSDEELQHLAHCYPGKPAPDTRVLLKFIKASTTTDNRVSIAASLAAFLKQPETIHRVDFKALSTARELDLHRMLVHTRVLRGEKNEPMDDKNGLRLSFMFQYLKLLEDGARYVEGSNKPISTLTQEELSTAFHTLSTHKPMTDVLNAQLWAVLFEVLGRTTDKYPHLAQQFALIAHDVLLDSDPSSILQLKTGEGKSHFVAMRAARHAGSGLRVDICTAKWTLAERDLHDYKPFFDYLGFKTASIQARSPRDNYMAAQIIYTTPGDLSLFIDEQANQGLPVDIPKKNRVGLGDEFDFLYYEGQKTQFNYARHTGVSPKQMAWFYRNLNCFYDENLGADSGIFIVTQEILIRCYEYLANKASEDGLIYLDDLKNNPIVLVSWLQSAHEAASLKLDINFTVRLDKVKIGQEEFSLQEIYPLTKDMQAAVGSTFSHGVHQLIAERLNVDAMKKGLPQNYHVHPESDIVSSQVFSQRLKSLWEHWEGFTGTVSATQAVELQQAHQTAVLRVPTNQKDLRNWLAPTFFKSDTDKYASMVSDIRKRLKQKKSILLCCATDAEVNAITEKFKQYFSPDEFEQHFLSFTNQSHLTASDILRKKHDMEGTALSQKIKGVVLIAAGFGRGDNVDVETVMLSSVHDVNDLGQKGGRTARNGEEGEVRQYYLTKEVDNELLGLMNYLDEHLTIKGDVLRELLSKKNPIHDALNAVYDKRQQFLHGLNDKLKHDVLLCLREFVLGQDNQLSLVYHEAKARLSSEAVHRIGQIEDPKQREKCVKGFAQFLDRLDKEWITIQTRESENADRINELHRYIQANRSSIGLLFDENGALKFPFSENIPAPLHFLLETPLADPTQHMRLMSSIQGLSLKIVNLSDNSKHWDAIVSALALMQDTTLKALLNEYEQASTIDFEIFYHRVIMMAAPKKTTDEIAALEEKRKARLQEILEKAPNQRKELSRLLQLLGRESDLVAEYLCAPGLTDYEDHISKILPMLRYLARDFFAGLADERSSYLDNIIIRDRLLELPVACFEINIPISATIAHVVQKFLVKHSVEIQDEQEYVRLFKLFVYGSQHDSDLRVRLFAEYEIILSHAQNRNMVLQCLARISEAYQDQAYLAFLTNFIKKIAKEYNAHSKNTDDLRSLDTLLKIVVNRLPKILTVSSVLERVINTKGKELLPRLKVTLNVDTFLLATVPEFFETYWYSGLVDKKTRIADFENMAVALNDFYLSHQSTLGVDFLKLYCSCLGDYFRSSEFRLSNNKRAQLEALFVLLTRSLDAHIPGINRATITQYLTTHFTTSLKTKKLLEWSEKHPQFAHEFVFNGLVHDGISLIDEDICHEFYERRARGQFDLASNPIFIDFKKENAPQRLKWMAAIQKGIFVVNPAWGEAWTIEKNKALFDNGLKCYSAQAERILNSSLVSKNDSRGLSSKQQSELFEIINELKLIAGVKPKVQHTISEELWAGIRNEIEVKLEGYQRASFKNNERKAQLESIISKLDTIDKDNGYIAVMTELFNMKKDLMLNDINKASNQFFPRLHFWGHSRLYRTLNDIEDIVLKAIVVNEMQLAQSSVEELSAFEKMAVMQQTEYVKQLKEALNKWVTSSQFGLFKSSATKLEHLLEGKTDEEVIAVLMTNQSLIKSLPGALIVIVKEVLAHKCEPKNLSGTPPV